MPKVSVIVPNYNHARFLDQRIESIFNQTYQDFEVILLDDASTDNSQEVLSKYLDYPNVQADFNTTNSGSPFKQWNKGLRLAQGEYIWLAESDDYADPTLLEKLVHVLDRHSSVGLAYAQSWEVDEVNTILSTRHYWTDDLSPEHWKQDFVRNGAEICREYLILKNIIPNASAALFRASVYRDSQIVNESFRLAGDWLAWAKILSHSDLAFISESLNYYRTHAHTARKKTWNTVSSMDERLNIAEYIQKEIGISPQKALQVSTGLANRLLDILKRDTLTQQHWSLIQRIANLNSSPTAKWSIYQHMFKQISAQRMNKFKTLIKSQMRQSIAFVGNSLKP